MPKRTPHPKQLSFATYRFSRKKRVTRRERFLAEMERVVPWERLEAVIEPLYPRRHEVVARAGLTVSASPAVGIRPGLFGSVALDGE
jgi:hypothetical protein